MNEPTREPLHVLLVDDDDLIRRAASRALCLLMGFEVTTATSGYEALALVRFGERFDAAVVDLDMPGMDGWDLVKLLDDLDPTLPVGVWTARAPLEEVPEEARFVVAKSEPIQALATAIIRCSRQPNGGEPRHSEIRAKDPDTGKMKKLGS